MNTDKHAALALADTMLTREADPESLIEATNRVFDARLPWVPQLCEALLARTGDNFHDFSRHELAAIILQLLGREQAVDQGDGDRAPEFAWVDLPAVRRYCTDLPLRPGQEQWLAALALPDLPALGDLARWLHASPTEMGWFADQYRLQAVQDPRLQHYHRRWVAKRSGGWRLIEIPKERLRQMQQQVLRQILDRVPAHAAAHGFRRGRSCVTHAALHAGQRVVIRMDLKDFFPSVPASRIHALFAKLGYSDSVAGTLARLCSTRTPASAFSGAGKAGALTWAQRHALCSPHLPQGSPCSPALANLCAWRLDLRLQTLAASMGAVYSRYADDLVFSGGRELEPALDRFHVQVAAIAIEEGFRLNTRKTRMMRQGTRQQVTGVVVNRHPNVPREEFDRLKATLTNCVRHGPEGQNREAHANFRAWLSGKVAHVAMVNRQRGARLQKLLQAIVWS